MKNVKKKILVISLIVALIAVAVGGTLAWFTDTDEITNVFTIGSIEIEQNEVFDEQTAQLIPVIDNDDPAACGNMITKEVTVTNTGRDDAYVQVLVAVPAVLDDNGVVHIYDNAAANGWTVVDGDTSTADVTDPVYTGVTVPGETLSYNVYVYRYNKAIVAEEVTTKAIEGVYIDADVDADWIDLSETATHYCFVTGDEEKDAALTAFDASGKLNVYVATQAVQARGFESADEALNASFSNAYPITEE